MTEVPKIKLTPRATENAAKIRLKLRTEPKPLLDPRIKLRRRTTDDPKVVQAANIRLTPRPKPNIRLTLRQP